MSESPREDKKILELRENFSLFDRDGDGSISNNEISIVQNALGLPPTDILKELEIDKSGSLPFEEFHRLMMTNRVGKEDYEKEISNAFKFFETEKGSGKIETKKLSEILKKLAEPFTDQELNEFVKLLDPENSGFIQYSLFINILTNLE